MAQLVKNPPAKQETWIWSLGWEDPLEEGMASHSSILAWRIPWAEEPGGLRSTGSQSVWTTEWLITAEYSVSPWRALPAPPLPVSSFALVCVLTQPCLTFWDPMDGSPPGSSVRGIFQARILEWVAISYFRGPSWSRDRIQVSYVSCIGRQNLYPGATREAPGLPP